MLWLVLIPLVPLAGLAALWLIGERGHILLPSTRAAIRRTGEGERHRTRGGNGEPRRFGFLTAIHGYVYGRWPYQYIDFAINVLLPGMSPGVKRWWADRYHGKVIPNELARRIITLDREIKRTDLERIIPYPTARDIVLKGPPSVTLLDCPCRQARANPCQPTDVCMVVGGGQFT
ncbi:MAG: hypothetical protein PVI01_14660, partial [Gemmatimonadales bacterium]